MQAFSGTGHNESMSLDRPIMLQTGLRALGAPREGRSFFGVESTLFNSTVARGAAFSSEIIGFKVASLDSAFVLGDFIGFSDWLVEDILTWL